MTSQPSARRIVLNVLSNWGGQAFSLTLSFFVAPFVIGALGDSVYGVWMLMAAIAGYLGLLDLGVRGAVTRYIARCAARHDDEAASRTASAAVQIFLAAGAVTTVVSLALAIFAVGRFEIPETYRSGARVVLVLVGLNVGVSLVSGAYAGIVAALQRFDLLNLAAVVTGVVRTGATVIVLLAGQGIVAMAVIQLATSLVYGVWMIGLSRRLYPRLQIELAKISRKHVRLIFTFSILSFLIHVSGRLIYYTDALVIAAFLPIGLLTHFSIGGSLVQYARMLTSSVSFTTSPMASSLDGEGEHERVRELLLTSAKFSMMILLPVAVTFLIRGGSFIGLWMGPSYAELSGRVLTILALPLLFHAGTHGVGGIIMGVGKHKPMVPAMLAEAGANLALSLTLVQTMGIVGVAWGTTIPSLISSVFFWPWYTRRALGIPVATYFRTVWMRPWLAAVPFALATYTVERLSPATTLVAFFAQVGGCLMVALAADWWICLTDAERDAMIAAARRLRGLPTHAAGLRP